MPNALLDDGLLDICLIDKLRLAECRHTPRALQGTHTPLPQVTMGRAQWVMIDCATPCLVSTDGEIVARNADRIEVRVLRMLAFRHESPQALSRGMKCPALAACRLLAAAALPCCRLPLAEYLCLCYPSSRYLTDIIPYMIYGNHTVSQTLSYRTSPQYGNGVRIEGERLILSKIGAVQMVYHRAMEGTPKTVTITRAKTGKWSAGVSCETHAKPLPVTTETIGVDMGLETFATLSTGEKIPNPRFYRRDEGDMQRVQKRKDAAKNAKNWTEHTKQKAILAKIHERIAHRRSDFAHQISRALVNTYQVIVFEEFAPNDMGIGRGMRKSIRDVAWRQSVQYTSDKAEEAGRTVVLVNPRNTSKRCSSCGTLVNKSLRDRVHVCPQCGLRIDRDWNAAINIHRLGLQQG